MPTREELKKTVMQQAQGAMALNLAFVGVANGLFDALASAPASPSELAKKTGKDEGYVLRWCEAAFAFGYLDQAAEGRYSLSDAGEAFRPGAQETLMPFAVQAVLGAHMSERAASLMSTGERPGERVLAERESILPWFGPMLETTFGGLFEREILPAVPVFRDVDAKGGVAIDLGCGNGWWLRRLAARFAKLHGIGLDGFEENVRQATEAARRDGLADRVSFEVGDIATLGQRFAAEPVDLIAMTRALHHVWDRKAAVFATLRDSLKPGGSAVIWEPRWPDDVAALRDPKRRGMAVQNLSEHVQGNHFLRPAEIEAAFAEVGMKARTFLFVEGNEAVVVGTRG